MIFRKPCFFFFLLLDSSSFFSSFWPVVWLVVFAVVFWFCGSASLTCVFEVSGFGAFVFVVSGVVGVSVLASLVLLSELGGGWLGGGLPVPFTVSMPTLVFVVGAVPVTSVVI